jgi:ABC-type nitrate/sulfonate/bicarbonate transport system substrate-binding protein
MMIGKHLLLGLYFIASGVIFNPPAMAASSMDSVVVAYSSFSGAYAPLWLATEQRLGIQYGLDLKVIYAGRVRPQQLLVGGEAPFIVATGTGALTSHILGAKDQVIVLTSVNRVGSSLFTKTSIKTPEDLRGKTVATGRPGAFGDQMVRYVLRGKLGLEPDRDVKLLAIGEAALALPALERGIVDAASLTIPATLIARKMGFHELANYDKLGVTYPYNTVTTLRETVATKPELVEKVLKTMIAAIAVYKTDKVTALRVMKKYMRGVDDSVLEETYRYTSSVLETVPVPTLEIIQAALDILSLAYPQAKQTDASLIMNDSIVKRIDQSGFIKALYKK